MTAHGSAPTGQLVESLRPAEVCLRTDLGNPHSHRVYQQLGFETVVELRRFQLSSVDSPAARPAYGRSSEFRKRENML